jgi:hypothetical protein
MFGSSGSIEELSGSKDIGSYGFSDVYWYTDAVTTAAWPKGELAYRF